MIDCNCSACAVLGKQVEKFNYRVDNNIKAMNEIFDLLKMLYKSGVKDFYCNCQQGIVMWIALSIIKLRKIYEDVNLHIVLPWEGQSDNWDEDMKKMFSDIISLGDSVEILRSGYEYSEFMCYKYGEKYMIDRSGILLTDEDNVGVPYAKDRGLKIVCYKCELC